MSLPPNPLNDGIGILDDKLGDLENGFDPAHENNLVGGLFTNMTLLSMLMMSLLKDKPFPKTKNNFSKCYDYIIVGGGTAGSVMANRLSEKPCVSVLLIEAGGYPPILSEIPSFARILYGSDHDWKYMTVPQKHGAFSQVDNRVIWNSGKAVGGSSTLNAMLYVRGNHKDYDDWAAEGCTGWSYQDVLKYFLKLEDNKNIAELDPGYHSQGGPMTVEKQNYKPEIKDPLLRATAALGYEVLDCNGKRQVGVYDLQGTVRNQQRCSTAKAYLVPAEDRPNLTILKRAFGRKIVFRGKRAIGVEFDFNGTRHCVCARKEVIISTGSVRAPQILMLSGIGPKKHLDELGIPVLVDLPVGENLQDHYAASLYFKLSPTIMNIVVKNADPLNILDYINERKGPLTAPSEVNLMAFLAGLNTTKYTPDFPGQELYFAEYATIDAFLNYNLKPEVAAEVYGKYTADPSFICFASLTRPYSRGEILLNSTDPEEYPLINPRYFEDERDLQNVMEAMRICKAVGTHKEMEEVQSEQFDTIYPACKNKTANETEFLECQARQLVTSFWHTVGTCRMGQPDDPRSVVDPHLKVIGVEGLRVVCAAVMPIVPSGNTNVPTMMVAEKIAEEMNEEIDCRTWREPCCKKRVYKSKEKCKKGHSK